PEGAARVLENLIDAVAGKALCTRIGSELAVTPAKQAAAARSEPQPAVAIFVNRPDFIRSQRFGDGVLHECVSVQVVDAALGANPDVPPAVFEQGPDAEITQAITHAIIRQRAITPPSNAFIRGDPDTSIPAFEECSHEIVHHPVPRGVVKLLRASCEEDSVSFRPHPPTASTVPKNAANPHTGLRRRNEFRSVSQRIDSVETRASHPKRSIA